MSNIFCQIKPILDHTVTDHNNYITIHCGFMEVYQLILFICVQCIVPDTAGFF